MMKLTLMLKLLIEGDSGRRNPVGREAASSRPGCDEAGNFT
jgi:hypothetical protein